MMTNNINQICVPGIELGIAEAGIKYPKRKDLLLIRAVAGSRISAVFTQNAFCAAPVTVCRQQLPNLQSNQPVYLLVNTGYANAGTGEQGYQDTLFCCEQLATRLSCAPQQILPFSTGVIGERLPVQRIVDHLHQCIAHLAPDHWADAAQAILTTDTRPKLFARTLQLTGKTIHIAGISKGAGMIRPNMATMLAYIATDLSVSQANLDQLIQEMVSTSFNRISVDGDTSTNDSCILIATGKSGCTYEELPQTAQQQFKDALREVFETLAKAIVLDGEGATKLITIQVEQGRNPQECLDIAYTIAHSPLVKTAFFAADPNWGRILAAVGRAPIMDLDINMLEIYLDDLCLVQNGGISKTYEERIAQKIMAQKAIGIVIRLHRGKARERIWTCDLSYDYVKINAEYRT